MSGYGEPLAGEDPIPGDPGMVGELADQLADVAGRIDSQLSTLEQINAGDVWDSDAADGFIELQGKLTPDLRLAGERYTAAAAALEEYGPELQAAQEAAELTLVDAKQADQEIEEAKTQILMKETHEADEARRVEEYNNANPNVPAAEPEPYYGAQDPYGDLEGAERRLQLAREALEEAVRRRDAAAAECAEWIYNARKDDLADPTGVRRVGGAVSDWASDRWDDVTDVWNHAVDILAELGRALVDYVIDAVKTLGIRVLQALLMVGELVTLPLMYPLGVVQVTLAYINGERDIGHLGRHFVNSRMTSLSQLLGLAGQGDLSYNTEHGVWVSEGVNWTIPDLLGTGSAISFGSGFITEYTEAELGECYFDALVAHEAVHADQYMQVGGGPFFWAVYLEDWRLNNYEYSRDMHLEAPAYELQDELRDLCNVSIEP